MSIDNTPAILTGSRAYGTPRQDSDIDLVCFMPKETLMELNKISDLPYQLNEYFCPESAALRFGKLNLIVCTTQKNYDAWKNGTEKLITQKPVTRNQAIHILQAEGVNNEDYDMLSIMQTISNSNLR